MSGRPRSALLDIQKAMQPFRNERVIAATNVTDMDLASHAPAAGFDLPGAEYHRHTMLRPLLTLFVQQSMDILTREHRSRRPARLLPARRVPAVEEDG